WSASFSLPRPRSRAAATAARSVTRTISIDRMRSSMGAVFPDAALAWLDDISLRSSGQESGRHQTISILLDADDLRVVRNDTLCPDRFHGAPYRVLAGRIGDEDDGRRRIGALRVVAAVRPRAAMTLHDRFQRDLLVGQEARDRRKGSRTVDGGKPDVI